MNNVKVFKKYYDDIFNNLNNTIKDFNNSLISKNYILNENLSRFSDLNSGGKLIRGILVNLGYSISINEKSNYSNQLSLAYEIFQTSILIHDDIIDNDNKRRNTDTIHYSNYKKYKNFCNNLNELDQNSKSIALCVGDYGLYLSNNIIVEAYSNDKNLSKVLKYYNDIVLKTIEGELLDVILPFECKNNLYSGSNLEEDIISVYKLKTAYYTIVGPLCIGMILGGLDESSLNEITKFGEKIGIAYQIQDDLLGIYSDSIGKVIGSDIKEFKQTILYSYIKKYNRKYEVELLKYYGSDIINDDVIYNVRKIFDESGTKDYAINLMNSLYSEGIEILEKINWINEEYKIILNGFVEYLKGRKK